MTTWTYGGTQLSTIGVVTLINDYLDLPQRRGDNQIIPYRHGSVFVPKFYGERKMTFGITISAASTTALETAFDTLRKLLSPQTQQTLAMTMTDASVRNVQASVSESMDVQRFGPLVARVVIPFTLCEPFFRSNTLLADNTTTINASPKAMTVTNTGTIEERDPIITLTGPLSNTVITNSTNGVVLTYTGTIAGGANVVIQTSADGEYTATHSVSGDVIGNVSHSGSSALMVLNVGSNSLSITDDTATTGTVKVSFYPPLI